MMLEATEWPHRSQHHCHRTPELVASSLCDSTTVFLSTTAKASITRTEYLSPSEESEMLGVIQKYLAFSPYTHSPSSL